MLKCLLSEKQVKVFSLLSYAGRSVTIPNTAQAVNLAPFYKDRKKGDKKGSGRARPNPTVGLLETRDLWWEVWHVASEPNRKPRGRIITRDGLKRSNSAGNRAEGEANLQNLGGGGKACSDF